MRLGVLDVGSNTVHLLVVDAHPGGHPDAMFSEKTPLRLAEQVEAGRLTGAGVRGLVHAETGVGLRVPSGEDEARYTLLAVRRWFGWSAGRLLVLDIGGGSLELAAGRDEDPEVALSLPLGAGRLTRQRLTGVQLRRRHPDRGHHRRRRSPLVNIQDPGLTLAITGPWQRYLG